MRVAHRLFYFILFSQSYVFSQNIYLNPNISGNYRITLNQHTQETVFVSSEQFLKIKISDTLKIEFDDNKATIKYELRENVLNENDTLYLQFILYKTIDTLFFTSGCLDGTQNISSISYKEYNTDSPISTELPEYIAIKVNSTEIQLKKSIQPFVGISSGNGKNNNINCGFTESTHGLDIIYSDLHKKQ